jgi:hypothetical protein
MEPLRLKIMARHAGIITAPKIAEMPEQRQVAILVAFMSNKVNVGATPEKNCCMVPLGKPTEYKSVER